MSLLNSLKSLALSIFAFAVVVIVALFATRFVSFSVMFVLLLFFMFIPLLLRCKIENSNIYNRGIKNPQSYGSTLSYLIIVFGFIATGVLNNYINPKDDEFANSDHHALRVSGAKIDIDDIEDSSFLLAEGSNKAFLDGTNIYGRIEIDGLDKDSIYLKLTNFSQPLYIHSTNSSGRILKQKLLNSKSLIRFNRGDKVTFHCSNKDVDFVIDERHKPNNYFKGDFYSRDSSVYRIYADNNEAIESRSNQFLKQGLSMQSILSGVILDDIDFRGISIIRPLIDNEATRNDTYSTHNGEYAIAMYREAYEIANPNSKISAISINGVKYPIGGGDSFAVKSERVAIPYNKYISVGLGEDRSKSIRFTRNGSGKDEELLILYDLPQYKYLSRINDQRENTIFFTSTLIKGGELDNNISDNNILFNLFSHTDNIHHITPAYISFVNGKSNEQMYYNIHYTKERAPALGIAANRYIENIDGLDSELEWLISVENFRETTKYTPTVLILMLWIIIALSVIALLIGSSEGSVVARGKFFCSHIEYAIYLVAIAFITIRLFLLWRISVFPPVEQVSAYEFSHIRNFSIFTWLLMALGIFYVCIISCKIFFIKRYDRAKKARQSTSSSANNKKQSSLFATLSAKMTEEGKFTRTMAISIVACLLIYIMAFAVTMVLGRVVFKILIPIIAYLFIDFIIYKINNRPYKRYTSKEDTPQQRNVPLFISLMNMLMATLYFLAVDGGFGIVFVAFAAIFFTIKLIDLNVHSSNKKGGSIFFIQLIATIAMLVLYKEIILGLLDIKDNISLFVLIGVGAFALLVLLAYALSVNLKLDKSGRLNWIAIVVMAVVTTGGLYAFKEIISGTHTEFRARVLMVEDPGEILTDLNFESNDDDKFLQASLNDWLIEEYSKYGKNINGTFELRPHSRIGAMWFAQTTDISLARFVIAEHSRFLPILFILAFLGLAIIALCFESYNRWSRLIIVQIPILITIQSLYIWMANTQRFIFFGQDFPLLSITSNLASLYYFVLMLVVIAMVVTELSSERVVNDEYRDIRYKNSKMAKNFILFYACVILVMSLSYLYSKYTKYDDAGYSVEKLLTDCSNTYKIINEEYANYQEQRADDRNPVKYNQDMSKEVSLFVEAVNIDSLFSVAGDTTAFSRGLFNEYVYKLSKRNSPDDIIHIRKDNSGKLVFAVKHEYYNIHLPISSNYSWSGDIVEKSSKKEKLPFHSSTADYNIYNLPSEWFLDKKGVSIVSASKNELTIAASGDSQPVSVAQQGITSALVVNDRDELIVAGKKLQNIPIGQKGYIARNVLINGSRRFIYPLQTDLYWASNFAQYTSGAKRDELSNYRYQDMDDSQINDKLHSDVEVTLDVKLTKSLAGVLARYAKSSGNNSVIVADGDGKIKSMVDYKRNYRLNPNDFNAIEQTSKRIYMEGQIGGQTERLYFGNSNLLPLNNGPGSTQKPIVWSAVTSGYNLGYWDDFKLARINTQFMKSDGRSFHATHYSGISMLQKHPFKSLIGDEGGGTKAVTLNRFIAESSNYYNSLLVYIGSFPANMFQSDKMFKQAAKVGDSENKEALFRRVENPANKSMNLEKYNQNFPIIQVGNSFLSFNRKIDPESISKSILHTKLKNNFGLDGKYSGSATTSLYPSIKSNNVTNYLFAEPSILSIAERSRYSSSNTQLVENMIRSTSIGARKVWSVTPLKMAEMYGRLISNNKSYTLTLDPQTNHKWESLSYDSSWSSLEYDQVRRGLFNGLNEVFVTEGGTANGLGIRNGKYYVYGKTGTIDNGLRDDHILATVITNVDLKKDDIDFKELKFYVIYTVQYRSTSMRTRIHRAIYDEVVASQCFKEYMEE